MKKTQKLTLVVIGLLLGACSSNQEQDISATEYEDLKSKVLANEEQWQAVQPKLDKIDELEFEIAELKKSNTELAEDQYTAIDTESDDENITLIKASSIISPAPIISETKDDDSLNESLITLEPADESLINLDSVNEAPVIVQPLNTAPQRQYGVQLASYAKRDEAVRGWGVLVKKNPESFNGLQPRINQKEVKGRTMYRLKVGPFLDKSFSVDFCNMLKEKGNDCLITQYNGDIFVAN